MNPDWTKDLNVDELPEVYRMLAEKVGIENTVKLSELLGGTGYYFPKLDKLIRMKRDALINEQFDGNNHKSLAIKFKLTEVSIRQILNSKDSNPETQEELF